ncbi:hypothetical protein H920_04061 [Fukomys damarensis]|uniref:Uncharacterized protein n=1 Tax=Fukomys damarensis TaxID=885580 RepID=A0A091DQY6_FUKDA|nr:hypothetical protein H920_04061 [Fukomys damarensis]
MERLIPQRHAFRGSVKSNIRSGQTELCGDKWKTQPSKATSNSETSEQAGAQLSGVRQELSVELRSHTLRPDQKAQSENTHTRQIWERAVRVDASSERLVPNTKLTPPGFRHPPWPEMELITRLEQS